MPTPDDRQLLAAFVRDRSPDAFRGLVDRHIDMVHAAACRQARDAHEAEDITQAVFIVLAGKAAAIRNAALLRAWLLKVAHFAARDARKAAARRRKHEQEVSSMTTEAVPAPDPEWDKLSPHLDAALARLSDTDRAAIIAHCIQQQEIPQLAASLGLSEAATRKRIQRAMERLRSLLGRHTPVSAITLAALLGVHAIVPVRVGLAAATSAVALGTLHGTATTAGTLSLTKGISHMLFWTPAKITLAATLALTILATATAIPLALGQGTPKVSPSSPANGAAPEPRQNLSSIVFPSGAKLELRNVEELDPRSIANSAGSQSRYVRLEYRVTGLAEAPSVLTATARLIGPGETMISATGKPDGFVQVTLPLPVQAKDLSFRLELASGKWITHDTCIVAGNSRINHVLEKNLVSYRMLQDRGDGVPAVETIDSFTDEALQLVNLPGEITNSTVAGGNDSPFRVTSVAAPQETEKKIEFQTRPYNEFAEISKIPLDTLGKVELSGVVRTGTMAHIDGTPAAGTVEGSEFYLMGDIPRPAVYTTSGKQITIKQALVMGGENATSPATITLIRRTGATIERQYTLELDPILSGAQDDMFVQVNDIIRVKKH